jgi:hypothetical protein
MVTSQQALKKYGTPTINNPHLVLWDVPKELEIGLIPKRIYCNKDLIGPLSEAFKKIIQTKAVNELKTWDGCFNIRKKRGLSSMSLHSWGIAVDMNAFENGLGQTPKLSKEFVECFTSSGFDWGGTWKRKDGMHFQLAKI